MDWLSNLFIALLLTDITGTIFFLLGELLKLTPIGRDIRVRRFSMYAVLFAYLVPFVYLAFYLDKRIHAVEMESAINLFYTTPMLRRINAALACIWVGVFLGLLSYRLYRRCRWMMICRGNIPEEDEAVSKVFDKISNELGISGKVSLCRNDSIDVPCITYHHGFVVMLPLLRYTEEEAQVIFYHELCHYLNRDMYLKAIGSIAALLHVCNLSARLLMEQLDLLCEECCDKEACKKGKVTFTRDEYFQTILRLLLTDGKKERYRLFALADRKSDYERRVKYMLDYHKQGGMKKGAALVVAACFLLGSSASALAAGNGVAKVYQGLAEDTSVKEETKMGAVSPDECLEENADLGDAAGLDVNASLGSNTVILTAKYDNLDPNKVLITDDEVVVGPGRETRGITWTIEPGWTYMISGFKVEKGDTMSVLVVATPDDIEYELGIKDGKDIMHYAKATGAAAAQYTVEQKARHYFYITNPSETEDLHIEAAVIVTSKDEETEPTEPTE